METKRMWSGMVCLLGMLVVLGGMAAAAGDPNSPQVSTPAIDPNAGMFTGPVLVTLSCATSGADIYYTTTNPDAGPVLYVSPFIASPPCTITAQGFKDGFRDSQIAYAYFTAPKISTPVILPGGGEFFGSVEVTMSCSTAGADIYYTTDGSTPTTDSSLYVGLFSVTSPCTVKARAFKAYHMASNIKVAAYTAPQVSKPIIDPNQGAFTGSVEVTLFCATPGADIYYTTDPNVDPILYVSPFIANPPCTVTAQAYKTGFEESDFAYATYTLPQVSTPTISPTGGSFADLFQVTLFCSTTGASIYYTTDGAVPTAASIPYVGPFSVTASCTVKARAFKSGYTDSDIASTIYTGPQVATPVISPDGGSFGFPVVVTLSCSTAGAAIYYTTNGSTPTTSSILYVSPITIASSCTIMARAFKSGYIDSNTSTARFADKTVSMPYISPYGGDYPGPVEVTMSCSTAGATIYYTTDGSDPSTTSSLYVLPFVINPPCIVKAFASKTGYVSSGIAYASYRLLQVAEPTISPSGGIYTGPVTVRLNCSTAGASLYYTTDGSEPTTSSTLYLGVPFTVTPPCRLRVCAFKVGYAQNVYSVVFSVPGYGGGSGTAEDPYQIWTPEQLNTIGAAPADWGKHFILMDDIDMSTYISTQYKIIGNSTTRFTGSFNGNGHIIRNLTYTTTTATNNVGLFGWFSGSMIKDLGLENVNISSTGSYIGGLVGYISKWDSNPQIINCYTTGRVVGSNTASSSFECIGGLAGENRGGTISNCYSTCQVSGKWWIGGLVGRNVGTIGGGYSAGDVSGTGYVGGLAGGNGYQISGGTITGCYSTGAVSGSSDVGGLVGTNKQGCMISNCYAVGAVKGTDDVGGLVGRNVGDSSFNSIITHCYSTGDITVTGSGMYGRIGGLAGNNDYGVITYCWSTGNVNAAASRYVGGLVGRNYYSIISDCYSTGSANGQQYVGGLAGLVYNSTIRNCYSAGAVSNYAYGFAGIYYEVNNIVNCFWDIETSGKTEGGIPGATGKTTAEMKMLSTFTEPSWWIEGMSGNALSFDGNSGYVEAPGYWGIGGSSPRTVTMWIKTTNLPQRQALLEWGTYAKGQLWRLDINQSGKVYLSVYNGAVNSSRSVTDGQWHHIAAVLPDGQIDSNQMLLYIDGQLDTVQSATSCTINTGQTFPVRLGALYTTSPYSGLTYYYKGLMDDVRMYDRGLDVDEILPDNLPANGLVAHWAMDETSGLVVHDSVSGHDGQLKNFGWDFVNGTNDELEHIWVIREGLDYPRFVWMNQSPAADAGEDVAVHCEPNGFAVVQLDGSGSSDADGDVLEYYWSWTIDQQEFAAEDATPTIQLPLGTHEITLVVSDGIIDSEPNTIIVTVFNTVPAANAGPAQTVYAWIDGVAEVTLDGSASSDADNDALTYQWSWTIGGTAIEAAGVNPAIELPVGQHTLSLVVSDGIAESDSCDVVITVIEAVKADLLVVPQMLNCRSKLPKIMTLMRLPKEITKEQIDKAQSLLLYPGQIEADSIWISKEYNYKCRAWSTIITASFDADDLMDAIPDTGQVELVVVGQLKTGQYFYGTDKVSVLNPGSKSRPGHRPWFDYRWNRRCRK